MTVKNFDPTNDLIFDGSASSFISRIDCYHSSNLLESIQAYNVLFQYLIDFSCDQSFKGGATSWGCTTDRKGYTLPKSGATIPSQATFCIPIVSEFSAPYVKQIFL